MNKTQPTIFLLLILLLPQLSFSQSKPLREETKALVKSNNEFAFKAYSEMSKKNGNIFFSPFSLSAASAMVLGGAKGVTADQIAHVMQLHPNQKNLHAEFALLLNQLIPDDKETHLAIANGLWIQKGLLISPIYQNLLRTNYNSEMKVVDFASNPKAAATSINAWAQHHTNGRVKNLVQSDSLSPAILFAMTDTVYFQTRWSNEFNPSKTMPDDFWVDNNQKINIKLMKQKDHFFHFTTEWGQGLEMRYIGGKYSMVVLLPNQRNGLVDLEKQLNQQSLENWVSTLQKKEVEVFFPKFELDCNLSLDNFLSNLGMPLAFNDDADFSGITKNHRKIKLHKAIQKSFIKVDEEGTEAIALTMTYGVPGGITIPKAPPPIFRADHPFIFLIRERTTNSILFIGRVTNPKNKII